MVKGHAVKGYEHTILIKVSKEDKSKVDRLATKYGTKKNAIMTAINLLMDKENERDE